MENPTDSRPQVDRTPGLLSMSFGVTDVQPVCLRILHPPRKNSVGVAASPATRPQAQGLWSHGMDAWKALNTMALVATAFATLTLEPRYRHLGPLKRFRAPWIPWAWIRFDCVEGCPTALYQ